MSSQHIKLKFWPFRSIQNKILSLSALIVAIGIIIGAAIKVQNVLMAEVADPYIGKIALNVYDTCNLKNQKYQDTVNRAMFGLIREIRLEQKRESYIRDETISDDVLARANAAFKRDSIKSERYGNGSR